MKVTLNIRASEGYSSDQVSGCMTVGNLRALLGEYDDDDVIITNDESNSRGACYGVLVGVTESYEEEDY